MERREEEIIEFIKKNPLCSKDSIFTKGKIPKSKATVELINKLISSDKIRTISKKRPRYHIGEIDMITLYENLAIDYEKEMKEDPLQNDTITLLISIFWKYRIRVLKAERKISSNIDLKNTNEMFKDIAMYRKNPTELREAFLRTKLLIAINNDKYYLNHQLHSQPRETSQVFQKVKKRHVRRSTANLLEMKAKGRHEFGLTGKDFRKNMEKISDDPKEWLDRFSAEKERTFYKNSPDLELTIIRRILKK